MIAQARLAGRLAVRDPVLLADYLRWFVEGRKLKPARERQPQAGSIGPDEARTLLADRFGGWDDGPALAELRRWHVDSAARKGGTANMGGDSALGLTAYAAVRSHRPAVVIETGVATGVTSAHILAGLRDNGGGVLHSIDLPPTDMLSGDTVGAAIPAGWKDGWQYHWGSAKRLLPKVLQETADAAPRMFVHDSDHSYAHMSWELRTAWEALSPGDLLVLDDVDFHTAFIDTAAALGAETHLIRQAEKQGTTGLAYR